MHIRRVLAAMICAPLLSWGATQQATPAPQGTNQIATARSPEDIARWQQDLDVFLKEFTTPGKRLDWKDGFLARGQMDFSKLYPRQQFEAEMTALRASIPSRTDAGILLELERILAQAHVAHNRVEMPVQDKYRQWFPIGFIWLGDGYVVTAASEDYKQLLGMKLVKVGPLTTNEFEHRMEPYLSFETEAWRRYSMQNAMTRKPYLEELGLVESDGRVSVVLQASDGSEQSLRLPLLPPGGKLLPWYVLAGKNSPLFLEQAEANYWSRYLPESHTEYIQYHRCENDEKHPFPQFSKEVAQEMDGHPIQRVVLDLRRNMGGNTNVIEPLVRELEKRKYLAGHIYVLIGPRTFSASLFNAAMLKQKLHVTLVGEPTGGVLTGYGHIQAIKLPNSGATVYCSIRHFRAPEGMPDGALVPDLAVVTSAAHYLSGQDDVLNAALRRFQE